MYMCEYAKCLLKVHVGVAVLRVSGLGPREVTTWSWPRLGLDAVAPLASQYFVHPPHCLGLGFRMDFEILSMAGRLNKECTLIKSLVLMSKHNIWTYHTHLGLILLLVHTTKIIIIIIIYFQFLNSYSNLYIIIFHIYTSVIKSFSPIEVVMEFVFINLD